jgi:hypothetical protein
VIHIANEEQITDRCEAGINIMKEAEGVLDPIRSKADDSSLVHERK